MSKRAFSTAMNHGPGGSATQVSPGSAMHLLGMHHGRPSQNCGRDHRSGPSYRLVANDEALRVERTSPETSKNYHVYGASFDL